MKTSSMALLALVTLTTNCTDVTEPYVKAPVGTPRSPTATAVSVGAYVWTRKPDMATARYALATGVATNSSGQRLIYAIGGNSGSGSLSRVDAYNVASNTWTARAPLPIALQNSNGVGVIGGKLYLSGGLSGGTTAPRVDLYMYNPSLNTWTRKRNMPLALSHGVTGVIGGKLYVHGVSGTTARLLRYDPVSNIWESLRASPEAHKSGSGGVINGKFYLAGGAPGFTKLHVYDPVTNQWTVRAPMPGQAHRELTGAVINSKLYVVGGQADNGAALATVQVYNAGSNSWSAASPMPTARFAAAAVNLSLNGKQVVQVVGGLGVTTLKVNEAFEPIGICKHFISLVPRGFTVASQANTCPVSLEQAGEYLAVPYYPEVHLPQVPTVAELPRTTASLHLTGGAPPQAIAAVRAAPTKPSSELETPTPQLPGAVWYAPDFFVPAGMKGARVEIAAAPCVSPTVGSPLLVPTQRYASGEFQGYYQDIGGPQETWRVALVTTEAIVAVDSAFWLRLPGDVLARAALTDLVQAWTASVLPTMARFGIARRDLDGDGHTLILVPETPIGATAYASFWGSNCSTPSEGVLIPSSRFRGSPINPASMADGVNTMMHEMFHLYEWDARPPDYVWYASEGNARLAEHVWRVVTSSGGSPFTARRTTLPIGVYSGVPQQTTTAEVASKHCVDPTLDGFDYLRVPANIRAYDTGCWFLGRLAAKLEVAGVAENMIFPSLLQLPHQGTMVEMWNEVTGESRTPTAWRARWLAGMALEGNGVTPADPSIRDPMWDLAALIQGSPYASEARFTTAPTLDAATTGTNWSIIDQSAQAARLRVLARGELALHNEVGDFFGTASSLRLLVVRLH